MIGPVYIARCPVHGLHGERNKSVNTAIRQRLDAALAAYREGCS